ncbi:hypothetical protein MYCTH_95529 [Thermothelomyces thermophilus ATCC 42464]|uniref:Uncharacterized protein n=1 Tax=Thermothelomyces thermophilus (strain ATCC 42464 / BCRC 31852 / DSM 1799) TaxID=573729 RepID=G2QIR6_THET4|nr:uncharacterized protein MYCTH_95529 [Thermothelomyces thermophilus ATCC 42464]AEO60388.1 hypothetical protein MYCTH_95529 [Thermothelomyces thermophilus ATCC 42464]
MVYWRTQSSANISQLRIVTVTKFTACSASNIGVLTKTVTIPTRNETAIIHNSQPVLSLSLPYAITYTLSPDAIFPTPFTRTITITPTPPATDGAAAEEPDAPVTTQATTATPQEMDNGNHEVSSWSENAEPNPVTVTATNPGILQGSAALAPFSSLGNVQIDTAIVTTSETSGALVVVSQSCGSIVANSLPITITRTSVTPAATDSSATVSETSDFNPFTVRFSENSVYGSTPSFFTSADSSVAITIPQTVTSTPTPLYPVPSRPTFSESPIVSVTSVTYTVPPVSGVKTSSSTVTFFNRQQPTFVRGFRSSTIDKVTASVSSIGPAFATSEDSGYDGVMSSPTLGSSAHTPRLTTPRPTSPVVVTASENIGETTFAASPPLSATATTGIPTYRSLSAAVKAACQPTRAGTSITRLVGCWLPHFLSNPRLYPLLPERRRQNHQSPSGGVSIVTISQKISFGYGSSTIVGLTTKLTVGASPTISTYFPLPSASFPPFFTTTRAHHDLPCPTSVLSLNTRSTVPTHAITYNSVSRPSTTFGYVFSQMDSGHGYPAPGYGNPEQIRTVPLSTESFSPNSTDLPVSQSVPRSSALVGHGHNISH